MDIRLKIFCNPKWQNDAVGEDYLTRYGINFALTLKRNLRLLRACKGGGLNRAGDLENLEWQHKL